MQIECNFYFEILFGMDNGHLEIFTIQIDDNNEILSIVARKVIQVLKSSIHAAYIEEVQEQPTSR